jgi:hypothetical protein
MRMPAKNLFAAATLLVLWIVVPLLSLAHIAIEEHAYCAEHQRLEEAPGAHGRSDSANVLENAEGTAQPSVARTSEIPSNGQGDKHEGCAFGDDFTREASYVAQSSYGLAPPASAFDIPQNILAAPARAAIRLILLAPKSSPPQLS